MDNLGPAAPVRRSAIRPRTVPSRINVFVVALGSTWPETVPMPGTLLRLLMLWFLPPPAVAPARPPAAAPAVPDVGHAPTAEPPSDDPPIQVPSASHPDYELPVEPGSPLTFSSAEMPSLESLPCSNVESMETSTHVLDSSGFVVQSSPLVWMPQTLLLVNIVFPVKILM